MFIISILEAGIAGAGLGATLGGAIGTLAKGATKATIARAAAAGTLHGGCTGAALGTAEVFGRALKDRREADR